MSDETYEHAVHIAAGSVIASLHKRGPAYEFMLQELVNSMGNVNSNRMVASSEIPPSHFKGSTPMAASEHSSYQNFGLVE